MPVVEIGSCGDCPKPCKMLVEFREATGSDSGWKLICPYSMKVPKGTLLIAAEEPIEKQPETAQKRP